MALAELFGRLGQEIEDHEEGMTPALKSVLAVESKIIKISVCQANSMLIKKRSCSSRGISHHKILALWTLELPSLS